MDKRNDLQTISILKVVCMLLVVFGHSSAVYADFGWGGVVPYRPSIILRDVLTLLGMVHTQAFTFASGFLFSYNRYEMCKYQERRASIIIRFKRLMVPYFVFLVFWGIPAAIIFEKVPFIRIAKDFILAANPAQYWFLLMLFGVYIVFYELSDWIIKCPHWAIVVFLGVHYSPTILSHFIPIGYLGIANILRYLIFFCIGILTERRCGLQPLKRASVLIALIAEATLYFIYRTASASQVVLYPFISIIGILLLYTFSNILVKHTQMIGCKIFMAFEVSSMGVYLLHQQIIYALLRLTNQSRIVPIIGVIINFLVSLIGSMFIVYLMRQTRYGRKLLGENK